MSIISEDLDLRFIPEDEEENWIIKISNKLYKVK